MTRKQTSKMAILLALQICVVMPIFGQQLNKSHWEKSLNGNIRWQRITNYGNLIVCTTSGLIGIDPETGKQLWSLPDLSDAIEASYEPIGNTPFIAISKADAVVNILEPFEGNVVFNSKKVGIKEVVEKHLLLKNSSVLIIGKTSAESKPNLYMIDISSGNILWEKSGDFGYITAFADLQDQAFLLSTLWNYYKINTKTGDIIWEKPVDPKAADQMKSLGQLGSMLKNFAENTLKPGDVMADFYTLEKDACLIGYQIRQESSKTDVNNKTVTTVSYKSGYNCFKTSNGDPVWNEAIEFPGQKGVLIFDKKGLIICPNADSNTKINMVDYKTGQKKWGKKGNGIKMKGGVMDFMYTDAGILLVTGTSSNSFMNLLDPSLGILKFSKYLKLKGNLEKTELLTKGLVYFTDREVNVLNLIGGNPMLSKSIKTASNLNVSTKDKIYVFSPNEGHIYEIDKKTAASKKLTLKPVLFNGNEEPNEIEVRSDGGLIVTGIQNLAKVDSKGSLVFHKFYQAPRLPNILRALHAANAARAALIGATMYMYAGLSYAGAAYLDNEGVSSNLNDVGGALGDMGNEAFSYTGKAAMAALARTKATANSPDFVFMMAQLEDSKTKGRLIRLNKDSGEMMDYIYMGKDKEPNYEVDNISNLVYYISDSSNIKCYKF